jgi:hypothetical protein
VADGADSAFSQLLDFNISCVELSGFASNVLEVIYSGFQSVFS